jgi:hypothetical protein
MQHTYGIYEGEVDSVIADVRSHLPLEAVEATPCPYCRARIAVHFDPEGHGFQIACSGDPPHISTYQEITDPPAWWKQRACDPGPVTFYWRGWSWFEDDGTLQMKVSGYDEQGNHWTGAMRLRSDETDYPLWQWIIRQGEYFNALISDEDLQAIREEYHRECNHS